MITIGAAGCTAASGGGGDGVYTMTAGTNGAVAGYAKVGALNFGTLVPDTFKGEVISQLTSGVLVNILQIRINGTHTAAFFDMLTLTGSFATGTNPRTVELPRTSFAHSTGESDGVPYTLWLLAAGLAVTTKFVNGNVYDVTIE